MANYFQRNRHELSITDPSTSDVIGFSVMRDPKTGAPMFSEYDGKALVELFSSDAPTQLSTDPERQLILGQATHHAGFGKEYYDPNDPKRYFSSHGMDLSNENNGMLSWGATAIAMPVYHTAAAWNNPILSTDPSSSWTDDAQAYNGNTANYADANPGAAWTGYLIMFFPAMNCTKIRYYWSEVVGDDVNDLDIDLYYNNQWNVVVNNDTNGEDAYAEADLGGTFAVSAARMRMASAGAGHVRFHSLQLWATSTSVIGYPRRGVTFNDLEYIPIGNTLYKLNGTGDGFTYVRAFPATITSIVPFQVAATDYLFIFLGTSVSYWYMDAAESFTESTAVNKTYQLAAWVNTTADTLYANDGVNTIRSTTNPLNGGVAWSAQTVVGAAADSITHMQEKAGALLVDKEDMPYYLDSSGNVQKDLAPECASGKATHSGKNSTMYQGVYYRPTGDQALLSSGTTNEWIQPAKFTTNNSDFSGQCEALAGDEEWLYLATDNSTKVEILKGREETIDGTSAWRWHTYQEITLAGVETMWISTVYQKRLWISSTTAANSLYYIPLPTKYAAITSDSNANFATGGYFETPWLDGGFPNDNKLAVSLTLTMGHAYDADIYFNVYYKKLGDSSWSSAIKFDGSATSMTETQFISTSSSSVTSSMFKLKFTGVTDDTAKTPVLLNYKLNTVLQSTPNRIIMTRVKVSKEQTDGIGMIGQANFELQKTCLANMKSTSNLITMTEYVTDRDGVTRYCKLLPLPSNIPWCEPYNDSLQGEQRKDPELVFNLVLLNVPLS